MLWMGCDGDDSNHFLLGAIVPENPVGAGCFLLSIGLENLFSAGPLEWTEFVGVQRGMSQVGFEPAHEGVE